MSDYVNHNPDILSCLANLSNDEVFTPPELANQVLDLIPEDFWKDPNVKVLDPACKSGVFLRECAKRFLKGLELEIPNLQERIDHIFQKQLFGYAITELTSYMSRRSVYCSKFANGPYSVSHFERDWGNINYKRMEHTWNGNSCTFCGAPKDGYNRGKDFENYAYRFIHLTDKKIQELKAMKFDLIISNPPYQLSDGGAQASARPIYHLFVEQAKKLKPRYMTMIVPSRWMTGGKGLDDFRDKMLHDNSIRIIHDFPSSADVFPGVQIKAGVCYFLWDRDNPGLCSVSTHMNGNINGPQIRPLLEKNVSVFIRYNDAITIFRKVNSCADLRHNFSDIVSSRKPFGLETEVKGHKERELNDVILYGNKLVSYINRDDISVNKYMIDKYKVYISYAYGAGEDFPHQIINKPFLGEKESVCSETYLVIGPFNSRSTAENVISYMSTKFFRFLVLLLKSTQHATKNVYCFVPLQDFSKPWTDEELYRLYNLNSSEVNFIESMIRPMPLDENDK